jgi:hypothetical protein
MSTTPEDTLLDGAEGMPKSHEDDGESYSAGDVDPIVVPEGTDAILYAQMLEDLKAAGFPEEQADQGEVHEAKMKVNFNLKAKG